MQITQKDIENLIQKEENDTFFNHLRNIIVKDYGPKGEVGRGIIKVWNQTGSNGIFYPVFVFEFNVNKHLVKISDRLNPVGKLLSAMFLLGILYFIYVSIRDGLNFSQDKRAILIGSVFILILISVFRKIYRMHKQEQLEQIYDFLDMEVMDKPRDSVLKAFAFRLVIYALALLLLAVAVFILIPEKHYFQAVFVFLIVGIYVIADIYHL